MISDSPVRRLADTLVGTLLAADPFTGTSLGLREYDALLPDPSAAAEDDLSQSLAGIERQARALAPEDADAHPNLVSCASNSLSMS